MNIRINNSQLKGRLTNDPQLTTIEDKKKLSFNFMYTTIQKTDNSGSHVNFIDVEIWNKSAEMLQPLLSKGIEILLQGNFVQKRYTSKEGKKVSKFIFSADFVSIIDPLFRPEGQLSQFAELSAA